MTQSSPSDEVPQGQHDFLTFLDFVAEVLELVESLNGLFFEEADVGLGLYSLELGDVTLLPWGVVGLFESRVRLRELCLVAEPIGLSGLLMFGMS